MESVSKLFVIIKFVDLSLIENLDNPKLITPYTYGNGLNKDQLMEYNEQSLAYDNLGNPTTYKGTNLTWAKCRQLMAYGNIASYTYNVKGIRTSKTSSNKTSEYYLDETRIIVEKATINNVPYVLEYIYGANGLTGFKLNNTIYYYKKNLQGDIIGILDENFDEMVRYVYDAWGNVHKIYVLNSKDEEENENNQENPYIDKFVDITEDIVYTSNGLNNKYIANLNPFRYRSYYYDTETKLYYLNSRYYDPEVGRFINADDISILFEGKDIINGLNLYAYCGNNPIMHTDKYGKYFGIDDLLAAAIGLVVGLVGVFVGDLVTSLFTGQWNFSSWQVYLGSALGGAIGGFLTLYLGPVAGVSIGSGLGAFFGLGLENLTGANNMSIESIIGATLESAGLAFATVGLSKFIKIPGITSGSHSYDQVWKSGVTKTIDYGYKMGLKTVYKGFVSQLNRAFNIGWLINSSVQGALKAFVISWNEILKRNLKKFINL